MNLFHITQTTFNKRIRSPVTAQIINELLCNADFFSGSYPENHIFSESYILKGRNDSTLKRTFEF